MNPMVRKSLEGKSPDAEARRRLLEERRSKGPEHLTAEARSTSLITRGLEDLLGAAEAAQGHWSAGDRAEATKALDDVVAWAKALKSRIDQHGEAYAGSQDVQTTPEPGAVERSLRAVRGKAIWSNADAVFAAAERVTAAVDQLTDAIKDEETGEVVDQAMDDVTAAVEQLEVSHSNLREEEPLKASREALTQRSTSVVARGVPEQDMINAVEGCKKAVGDVEASIESEDWDGAEAAIGEVNGYAAQMSDAINRILDGE